MPSDPLGGLRDASVYGRGATYVVTSSWRSGYGPSYRMPPYRLIGRGANDDELGRAVMGAVAAFRYTDDDVTEAERAAADEELFAVVGVRDESAFERGASLVEVEEQADEWVIEPWGRERGNWHPLDERLSLRLSSPTPEEVGRAVRSCFETLRGSA